jgi:hypothetical protein
LNRSKKTSAIFNEFEKRQHQLEKHEKPFLLSDSQIEDMRLLVWNCFEKGTQATNEAIANFLDLEISVSVSLDTLRHVLLRQPCFKTVVGVPMERERAELDPWEIRDANDLLRGEATRIS